jgi:hypothetical protein
MLLMRYLADCDLMQVSLHREAQLVAQGPILHIIDGIFHTLLGRSEECCPYTTHAKK